MFLSTIAYLQFVSPVQHIANVAARNHKLAFRDQIEIEEVLSGGSKRQVNKYTVYRLANKKFAVLVKIAGQSPRRYIFSDNQLTVVEPASEKFSVNDTDKGESIAKVIDENLEIDLFPKLLMLPDGMDEWKGVFTATSNWKAVAGKPKIKLEVGGTYGEFELDRKTNRISRFVNKANNITTVWTMRYAPLSTESVFSPPKSGYQVIALTDPGAMPKMDKTTSQIVGRMIRLYEPPQSVALRITDEEEITTIHYTRKGVRQEDRKVSFVYDGKQLSVQANGSTYIGKSKSSDIFDAVAQAGSRVDPTLRDLILGVNPMRRLLESVKTVKVAGSSEINGQQCTILQGHSDEITITFFVAKSDFQVLRVTTSTPGAIAYESSRDFVKIKNATVNEVTVASNAKAFPLSQLLK